MVNAIERVWNCGWTVDRSARSEMNIKWAFSFSLLHAEDVVYRIISVYLLISICVLIEIVYCQYELE